MSDDRADSVRIWEETYTCRHMKQVLRIQTNVSERRVYQGSSGKVYPLAVTETLSDERILYSIPCCFP